MTVFEAVSRNLNDPISTSCCGLERACLPDEAALDRWTNEGGALDDSRFVRGISVGRPTYGAGDPTFMAKRQFRKRD